MAAVDSTEMMILTKLPVVVFVLPVVGGVEKIAVHLVVLWNMYAVNQNITEVRQLSLVALMF
tara:strand:- start:296 stop:481 length:186 start_codon:yes stop_codon:yes gene_type:complete